MAENLGKWPSKRGPISKIGPSDGCGSDAVPLAVERWYEFHGFGWRLGNVSQYCLGLTDVVRRVRSSSDDTPPRRADAEVAEALVSRPDRLATGKDGVDDLGGQQSELDPVPSVPGGKPAEACDLADEDRAKNFLQNKRNWVE